jgi:hypothetical protein
MLMKLTHARKLGWIAVALTAVSALAGAWWWANPTNSFVINVDQSGGIVAHAGRSVQLTGDIQWAYAHSKSFRTPPNGILDQADLSFYFPDMAHLVAATVDKRHLTFSYSTPVLEAGTSPALTVVIGKLSPKVVQLQKVAAKLQKRIDALNQILNRYHHQNPQWKKEEEAELRELIACLTRVNERLAIALAQKTEVLSKREFPIQVDNGVAALSRNQTLNGGVSFDLSFDRGVLIQGESTQGHANLTNMRDRITPSTPFEISSRKGDTFTIEYYWNGSLLKRKNQTFDPGAVVAFDFDTGKADPSKSNLFQVYIYKTDNDDFGRDRDRDDDHRHDYGSDRSKVLFGSLSLELPVARDAVVPVWLSGSSPHTAYVKTLEPISAFLTDSFGRIDLAGFQALLSGTKDLGGTVSQNLSTGLGVQSLDDGATGVASGTLPVLEEGVYTVTLKGKDLAGNQAASLASIFRLDTTAPVIALTTQDHVLTRAPGFTIAGTVSDRSPVTVTLLKNGSTVATSQGAAFNFSVNLIEGPNFFSVTATDAAGNVSQTATLTDVVLDTTPPQVSITTPANNANVQTLNVQVNGTANEPLSSLLANGLSLILASDKKSFSGVVTAPAEGPLTLHFEATDLVGNISSTDVAVQIILKVLNGDLVSVVPNSDGRHYDIIGSVHSARPGVTV